MSKFFVANWMISLEQMVKDDAGWVNGIGATVKELLRQIRCFSIGSGGRRSFLRLGAEQKVRGGHCDFRSASNNVVRISLNVLAIRTASVRHKSVFVEGGTRAQRILSISAHSEVHFRNQFSRGISKIFAFETLSFRIWQFKVSILLKGGNTKGSWRVTWS